MIDVILKTWPFLNNTVFEFGFNGNEYVVTWFGLVATYVCIGVVFGVAKAMREIVSLGYIKLLLKDDLEHTTFVYVFLVVTTTVSFGVILSLLIMLYVAMWPYFVVEELYQIKKHGKLILPRIV